MSSITMELGKANTQQNDHDEGEPMHKKKCYSFEEIDTHYSFNSTQKSIELFTKWNLIPGLAVKKYYVGPRIRKNEKLEAVISYFLSNSQIVSSMSFPGENKEKGEKNDPNCVPKKFEISKLSCSATDMKFFKPLFDHDIITDSGCIRGCVDELMDENFNIQDKLREMLINPESTNSDVFGPQQKSEFLYHLLKLVCVGGALCQTEETFTEWKIAIKSIYKDLLSIHIDSHKNVRVSSKVFHIDPEGSNTLLFPITSRHNKCYIIIDQLENILTILYKPFQSFW